MVDVFEDVTFQYILRIGYRSNELTCCLIGHLLVEYLMNRIIDVRLSSSGIKGDRLTFFRKAALLNKKGLIPSPAYLNIVYLNKLRNRYAHNLKAEIRSGEFLYYKENKWINIESKLKGNQRKYIKALVGGVLIELRNYMITNLRIATNYK